MKSKKESLKAITEGESLKRSSGSSSSNGGKQLTTSNYRGRRLLFPSGPLRSQQHQQSFSKRGGGHHTSVWRGNKGKLSNFKPLIQKFDISKSKGHGGESSCPSNNKKFVFKNANSTEIVGRKTATFSTSLEPNNKGSGSPLSNPRVQNTLQKSSCARKTSNAKYGSVTIKINRSGNTRTSGKGGNVSDIFKKRGISKQPFSSSQKGWGCCPVINLKSLNKSIPINISRWRVSIV